MKQFFIKVIFFCRFMVIISFPVYTLAQPTIGLTPFTFSTTQILSASSTCTTPKTANITDGWTIGISTTGNCGLSLIAGGAVSDGHVNFLNSSGSLNYLSFGSTNGGEFSLVNVTFSVATSTCTNVALKFQGYKNGSAIPSANLNATTPSGTFVNNATVIFSSNSLFNDVDEVRVTTVNAGACSNSTIAIWSITTAVAAPSVTTAGTLSAFRTCIGTASAQQSFNISGSNLTANIVVTPPNGFEVSNTSGSGFTSSVTINQSGGSVSSTPVYVRLAASATGSPWGNITCVSTGATTQNVAVSGTVNTTTTWNGTTWSNCTPTASVDAIITSNTTPASFTCKALTINSTFALTTTGITATVNGNIVNNGNGIAGTGGLIINANSTISGNAISFNGALTVNTGATLTTGGLLTLASNATNTARVANSAGTISGNVTVQRYIPSKRAWRFLTAPLSSNGLSDVFVSNSWQQQSHIVGPSGTGLDATKPFYSLQTFSGTSWSNVSNTTNTTLFTNATTASNKGFAMFITGDRTVDINNPAATNVTTLSATGKLLQGTQTFSLGSLAANSYSLVGNPYASPVDLNEVYLNAGTSNLNRTFYTWDPSLAGTGGYVTISWNGSSYSITPAVGTSQNQHIQSGQAFFVQATATASTNVVFEENDKSTTNINNVFGVGNNNIDNLGITLQRIINGNLSTRDGVTASFGASYNKGVSFAEDAEKLFNNEEGITILRNNSNLSIERRPYITNTNDTIFLGLSKLIPNTNYTLNLTAQGWDAGMQAFLVDKLLSTETPIDLQSNNQNINITSATATTNDRWMIVFRGTNSLPNNKLSLVATKKDKDVLLTWNMATEVGVKEYELQRSVNGIEFTTINNQVANNKIEYNYNDKTAIGLVYYRVKITMQNDRETYSQIVTINNRTSSINTVSVFPNPVKSNSIGLQLQGLEKSSYTVRIVNVEGKEVYKQALQVNSSNTQLNTSINTVTKLAIGTYTLQLVGKKESWVTKIVVE